LTPVALPGASQEVDKAIEEAKADCKSGTAAECAAAWDVVEEIAAATSHTKAKQAVRRKP
jgi:hypothetical protein